MNKKQSVLFYCKHNSCRSQIAEAYLKSLGGEDYEVHSAGLYPEPIHPLVEEVLKEDGISIEGQTSKGVDIYLGKQPFDHIIIVCLEGEAECPKLHPFALNIERWPLSDPAEVTGEKDTVLDAFRHTRDEIKVRIERWLIEIPN
jgi:arsenate reductase